MGGERRGGGGHPKEASGQRRRTGKRGRAKDGGGWWQREKRRGKWGRRQAARMSFSRHGPGGRPDTYLALSPVSFLSISGQRWWARGRRGERRPQVARVTPRARSLFCSPQGLSPAPPARPSQLEGSFPPGGADLGTWGTLRPRPSPKEWRDKGGAREGAGGDLVSDPSPTARPPPPRRPGSAGPPVPPSPQGLKAAAGEVGGAEIRGKRSAGPGMKAERAGESRAELASLAHSLAGSRPPSAPPPPPATGSDHGSSSPSAPAPLGWRVRRRAGPRNVRP